MTNCRSCASNNLFPIIPLGFLPLANALKKVANECDVEKKYNLEVMLCKDCGLAQLKDLIDPKDLFSEYIYFSSNSDSMLKSAAELVNRIIPNLNKDPFVIEIASNDGYLLKNYTNKGINVLGIDPAANIVKVANSNNVTTMCEFFCEELAKDLATLGKKADVIHANNVMAHVPDINGFIKGIKNLLKPHGYAVIEVPYFLDLVENLEFDTIYHEHVFYFSVKPLKLAFEMFGLEIFNIEKIAIHGGTLRLFVGHFGSNIVQPIIDDMIQKEESLKLYSVDTFINFMRKINNLKNNLINLLKNIKKEGGKIAAYGASAKGTTLLNYFGINKNYLDFVVDRSSVKHGLFTPGTNLEIKTPDAFIAEKVSHALLLVWNFADEIIEQQQEFINSNGKFIFPLPEVKVIP